MVQAAAWFHVEAQTSRLTRQDSRLVGEQKSLLGADLSGNRIEVTLALRSDPAPASRRAAAPDGEWKSQTVMSEQAHVRARV
eukprot:484672-Pleurochrysis_carterae.AAC.1